MGWSRGGPESIDDTDMGLFRYEEGALPGLVRSWAADMGGESWLMPGRRGWETGLEVDWVEGMLGVKFVLGVPRGGRVTYGAAYKETVSSRRPST